MNRTASLLAAAALGLPARRRGRPISILFVGNSYTFGRVDPVMSYNAANVHDLTAAFNAVSSPAPTPSSRTRGAACRASSSSSPSRAGSTTTSRSRPATPPRCAASSSTPPTPPGTCAATSPRRHGTRRPAGAERRPLPAGMGKNANLAQFNAYADQFDTSSTTARPRPTPRRALRQPGRVPGDRRLDRHLQHGAQDPANPNASAATKVYLTDTWARPDMVFAHLSPRPTRPRADGRPIVDTSSAGGDATLYYATLAAMSADLHASFAAEAASNPRLRRRGPGGRRVPARGQPGARQDRRLLRRQWRLRAQPARRPDEPVVGRLPARQQVRLVPRCAGPVRHHHRPRPALARRRREGRPRPRHQPRRRPDAAADRGAGAGHLGGAGAGGVGAAGRWPAVRRPARVAARPRSR